MTTYGWVDALEAYCFAAVVGLDAHEVARRLGGDPASAEPRTFDECFWPAFGPQWIQVGAVDGGVLVAEHNGWRAEECVELLSKGAALACFYRNVHAIMHFIYAVDGTVLTEFDPLLDARPTGGADPAALDSALGGLGFGLFGAEASSLALVERVTGIRVSRAWLDARQPAVLLPPVR